MVPHLWLIISSESERSLNFALKNSSVTASVSQLVETQLDYNAHPKISVSGHFYEIG